MPDEQTTVAGATVLDKQLAGFRCDSSHIFKMGMGSMCYNKGGAPAMLEASRGVATSFQGATRMCSIPTCPAFPNCPIPDGLCHCGCGTPVTLAKETDPRTMRIKGLPIRFLRGHTQFKTMIGKRFGKLLVTDFILDKHRYTGKSLWRCVCDCGSETIVYGSNLRRGTSLSCGCRIGEVNRRLHRSDSASANKTNHYLYVTWGGMHRRCYNSKATDYHRYGGRGITICKEWREDFYAFLRDVGDRPSPDYSIDRIDNDGNYEPGNVRWATRKQQAQNRRKPCKKIKE